MGIFTGGKSTAIDSPRHLTLRHARRSIKAAKTTRRIALTAFEDVPEPDLPPGQEKLNSFWAPGLNAGVTHTIKVNQLVTADKKDQESLPLVAEQVFNVEAPQFALDKGAVHSIYPPAGYADVARILPHVVFTDPHLPWLRLGSLNTTEKEAKRGRVPWLALLTFTKDELELTPDELTGQDGFFTNEVFAKLPQPVKQTETLAVKMTVGDFLKTKGISTPVGPTLNDVAKDTTAEFIFVKRDLFTSLFSNFDEKNARQVPAHPNTKPYRYYSHVRKINTTGMALAGVEDIGIFSVVVGSRSGPLDNVSATSVSVHLVSIEDIELMNFPLPEEKSRVGLCSLYSWNYTVQPAGMTNVHEAFTDLGKTLSVLRPPDETLDKLEEANNISKDATNIRLAQRMRDGYSLVKYRLHTGEQTVAMYRGPFTPTLVPELNLNDCSNSGIDLQIIDKELGILDISYSTAWQLGRTLALGDQIFTAALARIRTEVHKMAMKESKIETVKDKSTDGFRTTEDVLDGLQNLAASLSAIQLDPDVSSDDPSFVPGEPLKRWHRRRLQASEVPNMGFLSKDIAAKYLEKAIAAARELAKSVDGSIYDETNTPQSTDWMILLAWVMNRMFLDGVPAHYLISDPSHLHEESLRFFNIDVNWVDAMIDGALSLANHMGEDRDRVAIKTALNDYIRSTPEFQPHAPQIPSYGFLLRSDLVSMFPDLKVTTEPAELVNPLRAPLLRHNIMADGVMLGLLDRIPGTDDFSALVFTQPPHQQRFAVASELEKDKIYVDIRRQYTVDQDIREKDKDRHDSFNNKDTVGLNLPTTPESPDNFFIWGSEPGKTDLRMLRSERFAQVQLDVLREHMPPYSTDTDSKSKYFDDDTPTSALFAMQLGDPIFNLTIDLQDHPDLSILKPAASEAPMAAMASVEPRTLTSLVPPVIPGLAPDNESDDEEDPVRHVSALAMTSLDDNDSFSRPADAPLTISATRNLAPNSRVFSAAPPPDHALVGGDTGLARQPSPLPELAKAQPAARAARPGENPAVAPKYTCAVYSVDSNMIYTNSDDLCQDLIFSVLVSDNISSDYQLQEFAIRIRLGPASASPGRNYLLDDYDGAGPTVLSNLRFNALASFPTIDNVHYLLLRLLPRSSKGWIYVRDVREMSFSLSLAKVNLFAADPVTKQHKLKAVTLESWTYYRNDPATPRVKEFQVNVQRRDSPS